MPGTLKKAMKLFKMKRWEGAIQEMLAIDKATATPAETMETAYYLGLCYMKLEQYDNALVYLEQVVTDSEDPMRVYQCRMTLAYVYVITKRAKLAEFELSRLKKNGFKSVQICTTMAYAAWIQKQYKEAVDLYEQALDMDEKNTTAMNGLGFILVDTGMDLQRGLRYCRKAVDQKPQNPAYLDSLGWAYYKTGDSAEARIWLRRAFDLAPRQPVIKEHLRTVVDSSGGGG